jgi:hypothetical protein
MIHDRTFTALLDANALYGELAGDLLLRFAHEGCFRPIWTELINEEWRRNLLMNRPELDRAKLERTIRLMNIGFPDAEVRGYADLMPGLTLPDAGDVHVLAAKCFQTTLDLRPSTERD